MPIINLPSDDDGMFEVEFNLTLITIAGTNHSMRYPGIGCEGRLATRNRIRGTYGKITHSNSKYRYLYEYRTTWYDKNCKNEIPDYKYIHHMWSVLITFPFFKSFTLCGLIYHSMLLLYIIGLLHYIGAINIL